MAARDEHSAMSTLVTQLEAAAHHHDVGIRLLDRHEQETWYPWSLLVARARGSASRLRAAGVVKGDRVVLVFPTGICFLDGFFGTLLVGAVPVPLYPPVRLGPMEEYHRATVAALRAVRARLVLVDERARRIVSRASDEVLPPLTCCTLEELPHAGPTVDPEAVESAAVDPGDLGLIQFSSGSTHDPKPVALSHRALVAQTSILNQFWPAQEAGVAPSGVSWLPLYHDMGLVGGVLAALERPGTVTLMPPEFVVARPALWLRAISRYRATISPAPNFAYTLATRKVRDHELEGCDLSSWRVALNGAEPIDACSLQAFARRFARWGFDPAALTPVYGLSEAALAVTFSRLGAGVVTNSYDRQALAAGRAAPQSQGRQLVCLGPAVPGFDLQIRGNDGTVLPEGEVGDLWIRGTSLMDGYYARPEATAEVLRDGWLDTGDLGFLESGELYLVGRSKDVVIVHGRNYNPEDLEVALSEVEGARAGSAVVFSAALDEDGGAEQVVLLVEHQEGLAPEPLATLALRASRAIRGRTGLVVALVEVLEPGVLPRTSSGKLRRREALLRWRGGRLGTRNPIGAEAGKPELSRVP